MSDWEELQKGMALLEGSECGYVNKRATGGIPVMNEIFRILNVVYVDLWTTHMMKLYWTKYTPKMTINVTEEIEYDQWIKSVSVSWLWYGAVIVQNVTTEGNQVNYTESHQQGPLVRGVEVI